MTLSYKLSLYYFLVLGGKWLFIEIIPLFSVGPWLVIFIWQHD